MGPDIGLWRMAYGLWPVAYSLTTKRILTYQQTVFSHKAKVISRGDDRV
jgi:hypothetical protein